MTVGKERNGNAKSKSFRSFWFIFISILTAVLIAHLRLKTADPDMYLSTVELIRSRNFLPEEHHIVTEDGFVLTLFRVVNPSLIGRPDLTRMPVLINHGLMASGDAFLINSPGGDYDPKIVENSNHHIKTGIDRGFHNNLGFTLANLGYDVWLANSRGNLHSRNHTFLNPKEFAFWDFSSDEMIKYDQPAVVDYVLKVTGRGSLGYIGHSQGTLLMFGLLATRPEYTEKVKPFIAIDPVGAFERIKGPLHTITSSSLLTALADRMDGELLPRSVSKLACKMSQLLCRYPTQELCLRLIFLMGGCDRAQMNMTRLPAYLCHSLSGTSWKNWKHYVQMARAKSWQMYDYGRERNLEKYGSERPPKYLIKNIRSKYIALISGRNDYIATTENVQLVRKLFNETVPLLDDFQVPLDNWSHLDSVFGKDCGTLVFPKIVDLLSRFD